jgi:hypothetical protein
MITLVIIDITFSPTGHVVNLGGLHWSPDPTGRIGLAYFECECTFNLALCRCAQTSGDDAFAVTWMGFSQKCQKKMKLPGLVNDYITMENHRAING